MTEYEKAMILLAMQQSEYLHIIACDRNPAKGGKVPERTMKIMADECPNVLAFLQVAAKHS